MQTSNYTNHKIICSNHHTHWHILSIWRRYLYIIYSYSKLLIVFLEILIQRFSSISIFNQRFILKQSKWKLVVGLTRERSEAGDLRRNQEATRRQPMKTTSARSRCTEHAAMSLHTNNVP